MDNQIIKVDYSEIAYRRLEINDFRLILFPNSPPNVAICVTIPVGTDDTFAEELKA
ncbi:hypothetical protein [Mucilaginibacter gynuensis]|uniref:hypothetical protein n=1 Tax=Mucilaginibacter gynuensis TaxID=1302236 RepID=UPI0031E62C7D